MSDKPLVELVLVACDLKAANAPIFARLTDVLRSLEAKAVTDIAACDQPNDVFRIQGRLKAIGEIRRAISDCQILRDTFERRASNAQR